MSEAIKLKSCPFCSGDAESDYARGFIDYEGNPGNAVAIYCTKCNCDMCMCYADFPEYSPESLMTILAEAWNTRTDDRLHRILNHIAEKGIHTDRVDAHVTMSMDDQHKDLVTVLEREINRSKSQNV